MNTSARFLMGLLVSAFILAAVIAGPAMAQVKPKEVKATNTTKVLHDDDRVRVVQFTTKPGENGASRVRGKRVTVFLQGGTFENNYADGRKEKRELKTGDVRVAGPDKEAYWVKNIGKTTIVAVSVNIKEPKK